MSTLRTRRTRVASRLAWFLFALTVALGLGILPLFVAVTLAASAAGTPLPTQTVAPLDVSAIFWIETPLVLLALDAVGTGRPHRLAPPHPRDRLDLLRGRVPAPRRRVRGELRHLRPDRRSAHPPRRPPAA